MQLWPPPGTCHLAWACCPSHCNSQAALHSAAGFLSGCTVARVRLPARAGLQRTAVWAGSPATFSGRHVQAAPSPLSLASSLTQRLCPGCARNPRRRGVIYHMTDYRVGCDSSGSAELLETSGGQTQSHLPAHSTIPDLSPVILLTRDVSQWVHPIMPGEPEGPDSSAACPLGPFSRMLVGHYSVAAPHA